MQRATPAPKRPENAETVLAVVVITRNEERRIGACLQSIFAALRPFPGTPVVVVDSASSDDTVKIAAQYPVTIYRYWALHPTAAAGRQLGFARVQARYVLFVDGDCCIEADWLQTGMALLEASPEVAVVYGIRYEAFQDKALAFSSAGPPPERYDLGGNALYRSQMLHQVGGFNPFLVADEEAELFGRLQAAGYHAVCTSDVMFIHLSPLKGLREGLLRYRRGGTGIGQVLRLSLGQGLFLYHARRLNRYLLMFGYLVCGAVLGMAGGLLGFPALLLAWIAIGMLTFAGLALRRRSVHSAMFIVVDWIMGAVWMGPAFWQRPQPLEQFAPVVERLKYSKMTSH